MKRELTLTDIAGYLPHKLQLCFSHYGEIETANIWNLQGAILTNFKPILRPMSDLDKEITHKGETFVPIDRLRGIDGDIQFKYEKLYSVKGYCMHWITAIIDNLSEWMFDYRGLIDAGLAVSVYDLKRNPYEK